MDGLVDMSVWSVHMIRKQEEMENNGSSQIENDKSILPGQAEDEEEGRDGDDNDGVEEEAEHNLFSSHLSSFTELVAPV